ncbi:unnamed protein product [Urochloa decumbens]|uniref:F-box/LRR-repeat protein 15/At3g58940/PEG3-like LRR domain-containing protein n=1 Tax=Urochloa decumbens TaxID=240449 RepID=A0ABC9HB96_9POAL
MAERTPELVATAVKMLPPRADASIVLGEERYEEDDVFLDLLQHGRVLGPQGEEAMAVGRWEMAWRAAPLQIHDAGLVRAVDAIDPSLALMHDDISTAAIGPVLEQHPGPVASIRVEASGGIFSPEIIDAWLNHLEGKEAGKRGLGELILINTAEPPTDMPFPLRRLPGGLRSLTVGFFALRPLDAAHLSSSLSELRITGCSFNGRELQEAIGRLHGLTTLVLGACRLTSGCSPGGLRLVSNSLVHLQMWSCKASAEIQLLYTPRLACLCTGVHPSDGRSLRIDLRTPVALRELHGLMMYCHCLSYITPFKEKLGTRRIAPLPNLSTLRVCMQMSTRSQAMDLLDLLRHLPCLTSLILTRVDGTHPAELEEMAHAQDELFQIPCIADSLRLLGLKSFRGGAAEIYFATHVLAAARELSSLVLYPHTTLPIEAAAQAATPLHTCARASLKVTLLLFPDD